MGIIIGVLSGLLWGLNDVFTDIFSHQVLDASAAIHFIIFALLLALMQDAFSAGAIFSYHASQKTFKPNLKYIPKTIVLLGIAAICAGPLGMVAGIAGISYAGPIYAGVVTSCYPVVALILAIIFLKERPTKLKIIGIILAVSAVISISVAGQSSGGSNIAIGILFASCAMVGWGMESILFSVAEKRTHQPVSWLLAIRQSCSAISYLMILIVIAIYYPHQILDVASDFFIPIMILACVISASTSYLAYYHAIKKVGASLGTTFNASFIFWAGIFSIAFNIADVTLTFAIWGAVLIVGIYFATDGTLRRPRFG